MAREVRVPVATQGMEPNPACVTGGAGRAGILLGYLDAWRQEHGERLSWPHETGMPWGPPDTVAGPERSGRWWPLRDGGPTAEGWDAERQGRRPDVGPVLTGRCLKRQGAQVTRRAGGLRSMIAGRGWRRAAWRLEVLCPVGGSPSSRERWRAAVAEAWPSAEAIIEARNRRQLIPEGHVDGGCPRGANGTCVLGWREEHGRIRATDEGDAAQAEQVKPCLLRWKRLGRQIPTVASAHRQALRHAIPAGYPQARLQDDDVPIRQTRGKTLGSAVRAHRTEVEARRQAVRTAWSRDTREALAQTRGQKRSRRCKSDERMSPEAKQPLVASREADPPGGKLRAVLQGVWPLGRDRRDAQEAREALTPLTLEPKARE